MAKSKKQNTKKGGKTEKAPSPFWKPEVPGETMEGKFLAYQEGSVTENGVKKITANFLLESGKLVPLFWSIVHSDFKEIAGTMKPGSKLKFEYLGKGGRSKTVKMWVNGKEMIMRSGFENIPAKSITKFFTK